MTLLRRLAATLLLCTALPAPAAPPAGGYSPADAQLLWEAAVQTFDGALYTVRHGEFADRAIALKCAHDLACPALRRERLRSNEMTPAMREQVLRLEEDEVGTPYKEPGNERWHVVVLTAVEGGKFPGELAPMQWLRTYAHRTLPTPEQLRNDPVLRTRHALGGTFSRDELARAIESLGIAPAVLDQPLANPRVTPLMRAVVNQDLDTIRLLLDKGASVNACTLRDCPLALALLLKKDPAIVDLLLQRGADVNLVPQGPGGSSPLALAAAWNLEMTQRLLAHKANPNPAGGELTPLMAAANREIAQALLAAGADPLATRDQKIGNFTLKRPVSFYAGGDDAYHNWLRGITLAALQKTGKFGFTLWIEQGGKRHPVTDKAVIALARAPFRIVFATPHEPNFIVVASEDPALLDVYDNARDFRAALAPLRRGAYDPNNTYLVPMELDRDEDGRLEVIGHSNWNYGDDPTLRNGMKRVQRQGQVVYVHDVDSLILKDGETTLRDYRGKEVSVVIGQYAGLGVGADLYGARRFRLRFR